MPNLTQNEQRLLDVCIAKYDLFETKENDMSPEIVAQRKEVMFKLSQHLKEVEDDKAHEAKSTGKYELGTIGNIANHMLEGDNAPFKQYMQIPLSDWDKSLNTMR